jgi:hypothetical protein
LSLIRPARPTVRDTGGGYTGTGTAEDHIFATDVVAELTIGATAQTHQGVVRPARRASRRPRMCRWPSWT